MVIWPRKSLGKEHDFQNGKHTVQRPGYGGGGFGDVGKVFENLVAGLYGGGGGRPAFPDECRAGGRGGKE